MFKSILSHLTLTYTDPLTLLPNLTPFLNHFLPLSLWRSSLPQDTSPFTLHALFNSVHFPSLLFPRPTSSTLRIPSPCLKLKSSDFNFTSQTTPLKFYMSNCLLVTSPMIAFIHSQVFVAYLLCAKNSLIIEMDGMQKWIRFLPSWSVTVEQSSNEIIMEINDGYNKCSEDDSMSHMEHFISTKSASCSVSFLILCSQNPSRFSLRCMVLILVSIFKFCLKKKKQPII